MITLRIYDSTDGSGSSLNEGSLQLSSFLDSIDKTKCTVERYSLDQNPDAFSSNKVIARALENEGNNALPIIFANDDVIAMGAYPQIEDLAHKLNDLHRKNDDSSCSCSGGCCG